jgi:hypothetical protein
VVVVSAATAAASTATTGRACVSPSLASVLAEELGELPGAEPWRGEVLRRAAVFQCALRSGRVDASIEAAAALIGLGEGSTPAGDDYLVGVLHALSFASSSYQLPAAVTRDGNATIAEAVAGLGADRTTALSAAWLAVAAHGEASPVWSALLEALASSNEAALRVAARAVRGTGHTSGAFSLRGFLDTLAS